MLKSFLAPQAVRITVGVSVGVPAAALCILRHLHHVTSLRSSSLSKGEVSFHVLHNIIVRRSVLQTFSAEATDNDNRAVHRAGSSPAGHGVP
jgi:hypothetical protein